MASPSRAYRPTPPERHLIAWVRYRDEAIQCTCGAVVNAEPDELFPARHEHLVAAWAAHRRDAMMVDGG